MIDILFLSLIVVAKQIASTDDEYKVLFNIEMHSIFKLKVKNLIIVKEVKAAQLITR